MADAPAAEDLVMEQKVTLHYAEPLPANLERYGDALLAGRFLGGRCPNCSRVYVPNRGYCPMCAVLMTEEHELDVSDEGLVASYTVVAPVRYYGQTKTEPFVFASILLEGTSTVMRGQDVTGIPIDDVHSGLRVAAVWVPKANATSRACRPRRGLAGRCVTSFAATGEPDASEDAYRGYEF